MALGTSDREGDGAGVTHAGRGRQTQRRLIIAAKRAERPLWAAWARLVIIMKPALDMFARLGAAAANTAFGRFISSSLMRRIVMSNLLGLAILFFGALYLSQFNIWLIDSKRESLQVRALTIANSLATDAAERVDTGNIGPFADLEFKLKPVKVARSLRGLLMNTSNRARIYSLDGDLIHDSKRAIRTESNSLRNPLEGPAPKTKTKNFWTRLTQKLLRSDFRVYKDPGHANGRSIRDIRHAMDGRTMSMILLNTVGQQLVSVATPVVKAGKVQGVLLLSTHAREIDEAANEQTLLILGFALCALAAAMIASYLLAQTVAGPMRKLSAVADDVTRNIHSAAHLPRFEDRQDEVGQLTRAFKTMTASLYGRIEASEKFAADVAHELKNPLAAARSTAQAFDYAKTDEQREMLVSQIQEEIARLNMLITDVSNASRLDAELLLQKSEPIDLADTCSDVVNIFADLLSDTGKRVTLAYDTNAHILGAFGVSGQAGRLGQVLTNLIDNAISFSPDNGRIDVRVHRDGPNVMLIVEDEGPGIDPDQIDKIFNRFYTFRPTEHSSRGNNSGLGLSITREIIRAHGGEIWVENRPITADRDSAHGSGGARFKVRLPAAAETDIKTLRQRLGSFMGGRSRTKPPTASAAE